MRLLDRYVATEVVRGCVLVMLVLSAVFTLLSLVEEMEDVGRGSYRLADVVRYVAMTTPFQMLELVPATVLLGSLLALGKLARHQELTAMQGSGVSPIRIGRAVLGPTWVVMVLCLLVAQFLVPELNRRAYTDRATALADDRSHWSDEGFWSRNGPRFLHVHSIRSRGDLAGVEVYEFDAQGRLSLFLHADRAEFRGGGVWELRDVVEKRFAGDEVVTRRVPARPMNDFVSPDQLEALLLPPWTLSLSELREHVRHLSATGQDASRYEVLFWQQLARPVAAGAMALMAVSFVLLLPMATTAQRILVGSVVGVIFYLATQIITRVGILWDLDPMWTGLVPPIGLLTAAAWLFRRA